MSTISEHSLQLDGVRLHVQQCGSGPLVLLVHGFPEIAYSWPPPVAGAGRGRVPRGGDGSTGLRTPHLNFGNPKRTESIT